MVLMVCSCTDLAGKRLCVSVDQSKLDRFLNTILVQNTVCLRESMEIFDGSMMPCIVIEFTSEVCQY